MPRFAPITIAGENLLSIVAFDIFEPALVGHARLSKILFVSSPRILYLYPGKDQPPAFKFAAHRYPWRRLIGLALVLRFREEGHETNNHGAVRVLGDIVPAMSFAVIAELLKCYRKPLFVRNIECSPLPLLSIASSISIELYTSLLNICKERHGFQ